MPKPKPSKTKSKGEDDPLLNELVIIRKLLGYALLRTGASQKQIGAAIGVSGMTLRCDMGCANLRIVGVKWVRWRGCRGADRYTNRKLYQSTGHPMRDFGDALWKPGSGYSGER